MLSMLVWVMFGIGGWAVGGSVGAAIGFVVPMLVSLYLRRLRSRARALRG